MWAAMSVGQRLPRMADVQRGRLFGMLHVPGGADLSKRGRTYPQSMHVEQRLLARDLLRFAIHGRGPCRNVLSLYGVPAVHGVRLRRILHSKQLRSGTNLQRRHLYELHLEQPMRTERAVHADAHEV